MPSEFEGSEAVPPPGPYLLRDMPEELRARVRSFYDRHKAQRVIEPYPRASTSINLDEAQNIKNACSTTVLEFVRSFVLFCFRRC
jgi:hypothetical protein